MLKIDPKKLRQLRFEANLSQAKLAKLSDLSQVTVSRAESDGSVHGSTISKLLAALSEVLDRPVSIDTLYEVTSPLLPASQRYLPPETFEKFKTLLLLKGPTQSEVAKSLGVSRGYISKVLSGKTRLNEDIADRLSQLLGYSLDEILGGTPVLVPIHHSDRVEALKSIVVSIPEQSSLVRFDVSDNVKLKLTPTLSDENNYHTIAAIKAELIATKGPIDLLKKRYAERPNVPQASLFGQLTLKYEEELSKDLKQINYAVLYARGSRFYAARRRAAQQIASGEWPELDADENEAIDAICDLHGPLIMATAVGRKIVEDAHQYEVHPDVYAKDLETIEEFGRVITAEAEIMEPSDAEAYRDMTTRAESDPQPGRSRRLGLAVTGSAFTVIVGGAAWYGAGGAVATYVVPTAVLGVAGLVTGFFWEAMKSMPRFKQGASKVGEHFEKVLDRAEKLADPRERVLLEEMSKLVERNRPLFERVANLRPEFGWAKKYLKIQDSDGPSSKTRVSERSEADREQWSLSVRIDNLPNSVSIRASNAARGLEVFEVYGRRTIKGPGHMGENDDRLFYSIEQGGKGFVINPINGKVSLIAPVPNGGRHVLTIRVADEQSPPNSAQGTLEVVFVK